MAAANFSPRLVAQPPKDLEKNLKYRKYVIERCLTDKPFRAAVMAACEADCLFFINTFCIQFNPKTMEVGPFVTWPDQDEWVKYLLESIDLEKDVRWQKSREVGASWIVLMVMVWLCLFRRNVKTLTMSRDEDSVDKVDDSDSLFWKIRWIHKHLPLWMRGPIKFGLNKGDARPGIRDRSMGFFYERTNSFNTGEANTKSVGVGGRALLMLADEFGQFREEVARQVHDMTRDTARCRVFVGTHSSNGGMFYDLCFDPKYKHMR